MKRALADTAQPSTLPSSSRPAIHGHVLKILQSEPDVICNGPSLVPDRGSTVPHDVRETVECKKGSCAYVGECATDLEIAASKREPHGYGGY